MFHWRLHSVRERNFKAYPLRCASKLRTQYLDTVKLPGSFRLAVGIRHLHRNCVFTELLLETVLQSLSHSCGPELTWQGTTLPLDGYSYRRRLPALHSVSPPQSSGHPSLTNRHWSGLNPYTSCFQFSRDLCF